MHSGGAFSRCVFSTTPRALDQLPQRARRNLAFNGGAHWTNAAQRGRQRAMLAAKTLSACDAYHLLSERFTASPSAGTDGIRSASLPPESSPKPRPVRMERG